MDPDDTFSYLLVVSLRVVRSLRHCFSLSLSGSRLGVVSGNTSIHFFPPLFQGKLTDIPCASINRKLSDSHMLVHIWTCAAYTRHAMMSCTEKFVYTETLETYSNGCYKSPLAGSLFFLRDLVSWVHFKSCLSWMCYWYLKTDRPHM